MNLPQSVSRREALKTLGAGAALIGLGAIGASAVAAEKMPAAKSAAAMTMHPFTLPKLDYGYNALEPHIDAKTMEIHLTKHHQAFITNLGPIFAANADLQKSSAEDILKKLGTVPEAIRTPLRNNLGGHLNHSFFWRVLVPGGGAPGGAVVDAIGKSFGSMDAFKTQFADAAMKRFGSGWAWLVVKDGKLAITSTANQDSPVMESAAPVLGLDVWEHAYYLNYQNRRADYVTAFWNVVNWKQVAANFASAS